MKGVPLIAIILCAVFAQTVLAQTARVENEYKLDVPCELTEEVWGYLLDRYSNVQQLLGHLGGTFIAQFADEHFRDQYFDTPDWTLLHMQGGIRHRQRTIIESDDLSKNGRELIQIKLDRPGDLEVNRTEIKFHVRRGSNVRTLPDLHPLVGLVQTSRREEFKDAIAQIGIDAGELRPSLLLEQRRRRVYIERDHEPFATITLDEVRTRQWMRSVAFVEIELELNESAYTLAAQSEREEMQGINDVIKHDIRRTFPSITQDQTPKYNKAFNAISGKFMWYTAAHVIGMPVEVIILGAGVGLVAGVWRQISRRRLEAR